MKNRILVGALVAGALMFTAGAAAPAMAADNLIVNGDFSLPGGTETVSYTTGGLDGWGLDDPNGFNGGSPLTIKRVGGGASAQITGTLSQTFPTEAGKTYTVGFALFAGTVSVATQPIGNVPLMVSVSSGAQALTEQNLVSPAFGVVDVPTFSFTATGATSTIIFTTPNQVVGIDNVSVTVVPENDSPLMIPAIAGGLGIAALGAGSAYAARRKNKLADK